MGFDVTYHPINENEMREWYFDRLEEVRQNNLTTVHQLAKQFEMEDFYVDKYIEVLTTGAALSTDPSVFFDTTHGFYVAVVQGFFRTHFYVRGSMLTDLFERNPDFFQYTKSWSSVLEKEIECSVANKITENYSSGVFMPYEQVQKLYHDYLNIPSVKEKVDWIFSDGRIDILIKAMKFCLENELGLLEATEIVAPDPLDLNNSGSYSNLLNCDTEGAILFQEVALGQIIEATAQQNAKQKSKKSLFTKLFKGKN